MFKFDTQEISTPALHAARVIMEHFHLVPKPSATIQATEKNLAIIVDVTTQIFRVEQALDVVVKGTPWLDKNELASRLDELRESIRMLEFVRNYLPRTEKAIGDPRAIAESTAKIEDMITKSQRAHLERVSTAMANARTVGQQRSVLQQAGLVR